MTIEISSFWVHRYFFIRNKHLSKFPLVILKLRLYEPKVLDGIEKPKTIYSYPKIVPLGLLKKN